MISNKSLHLNHTWLAGWRHSVCLARNMSFFQIWSSRLSFWPNGQKLSCDLTVDRELGDEKSGEKMRVLGWILTRKVLNLKKLDVLQKNEVRELKDEKSGESIKLVLFFWLFSIKLFCEGRALGSLSKSKKIRNVFGVGQFYYNDCWKRWLGGVLLIVTNFDILNGFEFWNGGSKKKSKWFGLKMIKNQLKRVQSVENL